MDRTSSNANVRSGGTDEQKRRTLDSFRSILEKLDPPKTTVKIGELGRLYWFNGPAVKGARCKDAGFSKLM